MPHHLTLTPSDGSPSLPLTLPASWEDITLAQYLQLLTAPDVLVVLTGLDAETIGRLAADDALYLAHCLAWAADATALDELLPTPGLSDVGQSNYGLLLLATAHIEALPEGTPSLVAGPYLYALYQSHALWGKVDELKMNACQAAVLATPVTKALPDVAHFLRGWQRSMTATKRTPTTPSKPKKRSWRQALKSLVRGSVPSSPSTARPAA